MSHLDPPRIEPDTPVQQISAQPVRGEFGAHVFGRLITTCLARLLRVPVEAPAYRCNPFDRYPCARAQSYVFTAAGQQVTVLAFEHQPQWSRDTLPGYALFLGDERVPFDPGTYHQVEWEIALALWTALTDRQDLQPDPGGNGGRR